MHAPVLASDSASPTPPAAASAAPPTRAISSAEVGRHYDQLDRFYREVWGEHVHHGLWRTGRETPEQATRALVEVVAARARLEPGMAVIDLGCGYGATSRLLARERGVRVTGFTVSSAQFWYAQGQAQSEAEEANPCLLLRDWLDNEVPNASQDAVIAIESIEHMADKAAVFREIARVLRPGGRLVVCAWTATSHPAFWQRRLLLDPIVREGRLASLDREDDYVRWMSEAGLPVTARDDVSPRVARTWTVCMRRFALGLVRRPAYARFLLDRRKDNRVFALTLPRIRLAYATGALRYVIYSAGKPPEF